MNPANRPFSRFGHPGRRPKRAAKANAAASSLQVRRPADSEQVRRRVDQRPPPACRHAESRGAPSWCPDVRVGIQSPSVPGVERGGCGASRPTSGERRRPAKRPGARLPPPCPHAPAPWLQDSSAVMGFHANPDTTPRSSEEVWCWGKRCPVAGLESGTSTASVLLGAPPRSPPPIIRPRNGKDSRAQASCGGWMELGGTQGAGPPLPGPSRPSALPVREGAGGQRPRGYQKCNGPRSQGEAEATLLALSRNISSAPLPTWLPFLERG